MTLSRPAISSIYEVNTDYHPFNLDNVLKPGHWPTARIMEVGDDNVLIQWESGERLGQDPEWVALMYFHADIPMLVPALGMQ